MSCQTLGIGVGGFLSGMTLVNVPGQWAAANAFVLMFKPVISMSSQIDPVIVWAAIVEVLVFLLAGYMLANKEVY